MAEPARQTRWRRRWKWLSSFAVVLYRELDRTRAFTAAAALAFYFLLSLVPLIILFSSLLGLLPMANVFDQLLDLAATIVPPDAMSLVEKTVGSVLTPNRGLLSFGILGYLWSSTGGFSAMIEALDIASDVEDNRSWWRDRLQALLLTFTTGGLMLISLLLLTVGPRFGHMLAVVFPVPASFGRIWGAIHFAVTFATFLIAIVFLYILGPNKKTGFLSSLPGAVLAVVGWFIGSAGFSYYVRHFSNYSVTYGSLGAVIVLMLWFYIIAISILVGAEANAELSKKRAAERLGSAAVTEGVGEPVQGMPAA